MINENAAAWLAALRSGDYEQTRGRLRHADKFCCLGVACDLFAKANPKNGQWTQFDKFYTVGDNLRALLPLPVAEWLGMKTGSLFNGPYENHLSYGPYANQNLVYNNDISKETFTQIADIIETHQAELFHD